MNNGTHNYHTWKEIIAVSPQYSHHYASRRWESVRESRDIDGEAWLADAIAPRHAQTLDADCGQGRVGGYLAKAGHQAVGVGVDPYPIDEAKHQFPGVMWLVGDLVRLSHVLDDGLENTSHDDTASAFGVIIYPDNVLIFVASEDRTKAPQTSAAALNPGGGCAVIDFGVGRGWNFADFETIAQEAELTVIQCYLTWDLRPFEDESQLLITMLEQG